MHHRGHVQLRLILQQQHRPASVSNPRTRPGGKGQRSQPRTMKRPPSSSAPEGPPRIRGPTKTDPNPRFKIRATITTTSPPPDRVPCLPDPNPDCCAGGRLHTSQRIISVPHPIQRLDFPLRRRLPTGRRWRPSLLPIHGPPRCRRLQNQPRTGRPLPP